VKTHFARDGDQAPAWPGDRSIRDQNGHTYRIFAVDRSPELQTLIDIVTERIARTTVGNSICVSVLNRNPDLITRHLAVSRRRPAGSRIPARP